MPLAVTINGQSYTIPQTGDENWGDPTTTILQDVLNQGYSLHNVLIFNADRTGAGDTYTEVAAAITQAAVSGGIVYFPQGTYKIGTNLSVPKNVTLWFAEGAKLYKLSTTTVTILGSLIAPYSQIFENFSSGDVTFGTGSFTKPHKVREIYAEWWGALGDDTGDDGPEINMALNSANGARVCLLPKSYRITTQIEMSGDGAQLVGVQQTISTYQPRIAVAAAIEGIKMTGYRQQVRDIFLRGYSATSGIWVQDSAQSIVRNVACTYFDSHGIVIDNDQTGSNNFLLLDRCNCGYNGGCGIAMPDGVKPSSMSENITIRDCYCEDNTSHGLLLKEIGNRVEGGHYRDNGGYGIQLGESGDSDDTRNCVLLYPWCESNTSGGIYCSSKARNNIYYGFFYEPGAFGYSFEQSNDANVCIFHKATGSGDVGRVVVANEVTSGTDEELQLYPKYVQSNYMVPNVQSISATASQSIDLTSGYNIHLTLTQDTALTLNNEVVGVRYLFLVIQDSTGGWDITNWCTGDTIYWAGGSAPNISGMGADDRKVVTLYYDGTQFLGHYGDTFSI